MSTQTLQEVIASSSPELISLWEGMKIQSTEQAGTTRWKRALQRKLGTEAPLILITPSYASFGGKQYAQIEVRYAVDGDVDYFFAYDGFLETYNLYLESHGYVISSYSEGYGNYVCINLNKKEEALELSPYPLHFGEQVFQNRTELDAWLSTR